MADKGDERSYGRRSFFREGFREMLSPLADLLAERIRDMPDFSSLSPEDSFSEKTVFLRPPGALPEEQFLVQCLRCGCCQGACPHGAITLLKREEITESGQPDAYSWRPYRETGTPRIVPAAEPMLRSIKK